MKNAAINNVEPSAYRDDIERHGLTDLLNTSDIAINHYVIDPDERLSGLHAHMDQEEVFFVVDGEMTFETMNGEITVGESEAIRFAPGEFQSGKNDSDGEVTAVAVGTPRDSEDIRIPLACPECDHDNMRLKLSESGEALVCPDCGAESSAECPECGQDELRAVLSNDREKPISVCQNCGAESVA